MAASSGNGSPGQTGWPSLIAPAVSKTDATGLPKETTPSPLVGGTVTPQTPRELFDLEQGRIASAGSVTLALDPATTTTVVHRGAVSATSIVILVPVNEAAAGLEGAYWVEPQTDQFVVHHHASTLDRTYHYAIFTPTQRRG